MAATMDDRRRDEIVAWLPGQLGHADFTLTPASADASFRRYFRVSGAWGSHVVMDAPPEQEPCDAFIAISRTLHSIGLNVPRVLAHESERGFLLLTDLGSVSYLERLDEQSADGLYGDACKALLRLQRYGPRSGLPSYDRERLLGEMRLFESWYLSRHRQYSPAPSQLAELQQVYEHLIESALAQPQCCVHRDYHSRNLMVCPNGKAQCCNPGILDFQDAVVGPITYDLVSLFRDCYITWPQQRVEDWVLEYRNRLRSSGLATGRDEAEFLRWFDWMGVQRHLKVAGIFARLWHRDGKGRYLADLPLTLHYIASVASRYPELEPLLQFPGVERIG